MIDWPGTPENDSRGATPRRSWSFTFGPSDREMQGLAGAARSEGGEPVANVGRYQLDVGQLARLLFERMDPWRPLRQALALVRGTIVFGLLAGGVAIGYWDAGVGPIWGGIYGLVFAAFFYRTTTPRGLATQRRRRVRWGGAEDRSGQSAMDAIIFDSVNPRRPDGRLTSVSDSVRPARVGR